jgi:hypothetical protein
MNTRTRWLRSEWPTSTTMLELPVYLLVVGAMALVGVSSYAYARRHMQVMEALSIMAGARVTMMEFKAVTGVWPKSNGEAGFSDAMFKAGDPDFRRVNEVQIRDGGAVDFRFGREALKHRVLSIRAWQGRSPGLPVEWICGHPLALPGTSAAADQTTVSEADLPSPCRAHK